MALNNVSYEISESFIENYIASEKIDKKIDWENKVKEYKELLKKHSIIKRIYENENVLYEFETFKNDELDNMTVETLSSPHGEDISIFMNNQNQCIII